MTVPVCEFTTYGVDGRVLVDCMEYNTQEYETGKGPNVHLCIKHRGWLAALGRIVTPEERS